MTMLFSHIPKTAGTSVKALIERYSPDATFLYDGEVQLANPNIDFLQRFRRSRTPPIVMGHFSFGAHRLLGVSPLYSSILRDPVARVISLHTYFTRGPDFIRPAFFNPSMTLDEFASTPITEQNNNHMCRIIAGIAPESGLAIYDEWLLGLALHNLDRHYALVATLERVDDFVSHLARRFGWGNVTVPHDNRTDSGRLDVTARTRATIAERNELDIRLYEYLESRGGLIVREIV